MPGTIARLDNARNVLETELNLAIDELGKIPNQMSPEWIDLKRAIARTSAPLPNGFTYGEVAPR